MNSGVTSHASKIAKYSYLILYIGIEAKQDTGSTHIFENLEHYNFHCLSGCALFFVSWQRDSVGKAA